MILPVEQNPNKSSLIKHPPCSSISPSPTQAYRLRIFHRIYPSISCPDHTTHNPPQPRRWRRRAKEWHMQIYLIGWKIGMRQGSLPWMFFPPTSQPISPPCFILLSYFHFSSLWPFFFALRVPLSDPHNDHLCPCLFLCSSTVPPPHSFPLFFPHHPPNLTLQFFF